MAAEFRLEDSMARPKSAPKSRNIKITVDAYESARIASGFTGESIVDFVSRIIKDQGEKIIDEQYKLRKAKEKESGAKESGKK